MIKLAVKGIIFLMGIQSMFGKLQSEGVVSGSIKINYSVIQEKVTKIINSQEVDNIIQNLEQTENNTNNYYEETPQNDLNIQKRVKVFNHIVKHGETLSDLGAEYGISWKVIKKANHIYNENSINVGQNLIIPVVQRNLA